MSKWYIICTRKGWEKKVERLLQEKGLVGYCPLVRIKRQWSDRTKWLAAPLFGSHIFVKMTPEERAAVRMTPGVKNFVYANGKPATVKRKEMDGLRQLLAGGGLIEVFSANGLTGPDQRPVEEAKRIPGQRIKKTTVVIGEKRYEVRSTSAMSKRLSVPVANAMQ